MKENIDYELIPGKDEAWAIRLLTGDFIETEYQYNALVVSEDGENLTFSVDILKSPIDKVDEDDSFQSVTGDVLLQIIESALERDNERNAGTTDIEEYPYE